MAGRVNYGTIEALRREDEKMADALQFIVPIKHANGLWGPGAYPDKGEINVTEKANYAKLLTGKKVKPVVSITEEDIKKLKDKAWKATLWDFDNWVGEYLEPNKNPVNKALLAKIYPEWLERQKAVIENYHDFKKRVETLKITGPKNKEDLFLFYRLGYPKSTDQGKNKAFAHYANNEAAPGLMDKEMDTKKQQTRFQRGLFNINRRRAVERSTYGYPHSIFATTPDPGVTSFDPYDPLPIPKFSNDDE